MTENGLAALAGIRYSVFGIRYSVFGIRRSVRFPLDRVPMTDDRLPTTVLAMHLGLNLGYWGTALAGDTTLVTEAERLGYDSVWTAEAYGSDAVTPLACSASESRDHRWSRVGTAVLMGNHSG